MSEENHVYHTFIIEISVCLLFKLNLNSSFKTRKSFIGNLKLEAVCRELDNRGIGYLQYHKCNKEKKFANAII
ncbi:hypothetical protein DF185_10380 [Marinifilum breve]|uniref:Uncharacterized protein n=1 Tax=Marinifilum breve TaxID=2184082 RepID=A0A2V3ZX60_9BACT|nr:hypothetical protein DF185_10380 [Marinifilum breve]